MCSNFPSGINDVADEHIYSSNKNNHSSVHFPSGIDDVADESISVNNDNH